MTKTAEQARDIQQEYEAGCVTIAAHYVAALAAHAARYGLMHDGPDFETRGGVSWMGKRMSVTIAAYGDDGQRKCREAAQALLAHVDRPVEEHVLLVATAGQRPQ